MWRRRCDQGCLFYEFRLEDRMEPPMRRSVSKARAAVARKLTVILHRMRIDGTEFNWSSEETSRIGPGICTPSAPAQSRPCVRTNRHSR